MKFTKTPQELFDFIANAIKGYDCTCRRMFGGVGYFVNNNMFTGAHQGVIFLRLSGNDQKLIMNEYDEVTHFEPMPGRPMSEYMAIPENVFSRPNMLQEWLDKSYRYVSLLAPKKKKELKKKTTKIKDGH
jgi:TfoX/Sxy family transcriptional regulator of competence genes